MGEEHADTNGGGGRGYATRQAVAEPKPAGPRLPLSTDDQSAVAMEAIAARYTGVVEALGEVVYDYDRVRDRTILSGAVEHLLGFVPPAEGLSGDDWVALMHPDDVQIAFRELEAAIKERRLFDCEYR